MKNITISVDEALARAIRIEAAKAGISMSKFISESARQRIEGGVSASQHERNLQKEALAKILDGPMWDVTENGRMPTAEERNARR